MTIKFTMLMELATNSDEIPFRFPKRIGGWSESWYAPGTDVGSILLGARVGIGGLPGLLPSRAGLLPRSASIVGQRLQLVSPVGQSQSAAFQFPGSFIFATEIPQMALLTRVPGAGVPNIRRNILRGIPDEMVDQGEFRPTAGYNTLLNTFHSSLGAWSFRGRDLTLPAVKLFTVTSGGVFTTETPHGLAVNDIVRVLRTLQPSGQFFGGRFMVLTIGPGTNAGSFNLWTGGSTTGGTVRRDAVIFPPVFTAGISVSRIITRRVGRPFTQFRGRRARR